MKPLFSSGLIGLGLLCLGGSAQAFDYGNAIKGVLEKNKVNAATPATPANAAASNSGAGVSSLTSSEMNSGLKEALSRGAEMAVAQ